MPELPIGTEIVLSLTYPDGFEEDLRGVKLGDGRCQLTTFSWFAPLAPRDIVYVSPRSDIIGIEKEGLAFIVDAYFRLDTPEATVVEVAEQWATAAPICKTTPKTVLVASDSHQWIQDVVLAHELVTHHEVIRTPAKPVDLSNLEEYQR